MNQILLPRTSKVLCEVVENLVLDRIPSSPSLWKNSRQSSDKDPTGNNPKLLDRKI